jgi:hypothetical protein
MQLSAAGLENKGQHYENYRGDRRLAPFLLKVQPWVDRPLRPVWLMFPTFIKRFFGARRPRLARVRAKTK